MVCEWGMSDKLGPLTFGKREEQIFLGKELTRHKDYSEKTAEDIDGEVRTIVGERYDYAKQLLLDNRETLEKVAERLLDKETLDADELEDVITGNNGSTAKDEKLVKESDEVKKAEGVEEAKDDKKDNDENGAA
jgi:cell division protease FtsH